MISLNQNAQDPLEIEPGCLRHWFVFCLFKPILSDRAVSHILAGMPEAFFSAV